MADGTERAKQAMSEALALLIDGKLVQEHDPGDDGIFSVPEERRIALEYYKNNVLHYFVSSALISLGARSGRRGPGRRAGAAGPGADPVASVQVRVHVPRRRDVRPDFFEEALAEMLRLGELEREGDLVSRASGPAGGRVEVYATLLRTYFESYSLATRVLSEMSDNGLSKRDWLKRGLTLGQRMYLAGELNHRESISKPKLFGALEHSERTTNSPASPAMGRFSGRGLGHEQARRSCAGLRVSPEPLPGLAVSKNAGRPSALENRRTRVLWIEAVLVP